ncbi:S-layer homology domain-containing protein [Sporosarcina gallistercoris]|uniref:S-layer homology domain-containing protein n=1 Tax=Sporosarcina gallistercoris TaxID=2762245 RepID=A0ABR8PN85_9BACL|nr:S-layer homology domain-containing protein [Sporosarcina gallistercoris]MBD7909641.1 S-layer homology domain-containing protein [Sporosarcina gallistercoris]
MKRVFPFLLVFLLVFAGVTSEVSAATFKDTPKSYRFFNEINYLSNEGVITGYPDGRFQPEKPVTRAATVIMIGRALNLDGTQRKTKFPDVSPKSAAAGYIQSAVDAGIISGYPTGEFRPDSAVSRAELAIFLTRAFKFEKSSTETFKDVLPHMASYQYVQKLVGENITSGFADGTYRPDTAVTRGQFSAFMARTLDDKFKPKPDILELSWQDNTEKIEKVTVLQEETK